MIRLFPYLLRRTAWVVMAVLLLMACTSNDYDTGDGKMSHYRADFVDAYTNSNAAFVKAMTDDGDSLVFSAPL